MPVIEGLTLLAALSRMSGQTAVKGCGIRDFAQRDSSSWIFDSLAELDVLLSDVDVPQAFRPTGYAFFSARKRLLDTSALVVQKPRITLDGEGGIDIEWEHSGRLLMFSCRANANQQDYIYFQDHDTYGGADYSSIYSADRLNWFLKG